jgi:hypothetical protein
MNIYCVKGVAPYHEFVCAMRAVCATVPDGMWTGQSIVYSVSGGSIIKTKLWPPDLLDLKPYFEQGVC